MTISPGDWIGPDGKPRDGAPLGMLLSAQAASQPDALALAINGQCYSFAQMDAAANRLARHLATRSVVAGSHVVLSMPNRVEMVQAVFALWKLGAVPCPVSWRLSEREFCAIVGLIAPCCVIGTAATPVVAENFIDIDAGLPEGLSPAPLPPAISDPGKVLTSGGSTGQPKLIVDPIPAVWGRDKAVPYRPAGTTVLNAGPMYHTAPFNFCAVAMAEGSHIVSMTSFEPREWLDLV